MLRRIFTVSALIAGFLVTPLAQAEDYPNKPIRLIVPYSPGGGTDVAARRLANEMGKGLGQRIAVENIGGAGGNIGMQTVAKAVPDGYTLVLALTAQFAVNKSLYANLPYDPVKDFEPVSLLAVAPYVLVVHKDLPVKTVADLIQLAKKEPNKLSYASAGNGSGAHLSAELLKSMAGIEMISRALSRGRLCLCRSVSRARAGHVFHLRANCWLSSVRNNSSDRRQHREAGGQLADVPAVAETLPGYRSDVWYVLAAPAGTPPDIIARLNKEAMTALQSSDIQKQFGEDLFQISASRPDAVKPFIESEIVKWGDVVKKSGARIE